MTQPAMTFSLACLLMTGCGAGLDRPPALPPVAMALATGKGVAASLEPFGELKAFERVSDAAIQRMAADSVNRLRTLAFMADRVKEGYDGLRAIHQALGTNNVVVMGGYAAALTVQNSLDSQFRILWAALYQLLGGPQVPDREVFVLGDAMMKGTIDDRAVGLAFLGTVAQYHSVAAVRDKAAAVVAQVREMQGQAAVDRLHAAYRRFRDDSENGLPPHPGNQ